MAWGGDPPRGFLRNNTSVIPFRVGSFAGVVRGDRAVQILVPGAGMSIYDRHLGPAAGCAGIADPKQREKPA
jgi:hypothetical protein